MSIEKEWGKSSIIGEIPSQLEHSPNLTFKFYSKSGFLGFNDSSENLVHKPPNPRQIPASP